MDKVQIKKLYGDAITPLRANADDAGLDLFFYGQHDVKLEPGERAIFPTGLAIAIPKGKVGLVHSRSGLAANSGMAVLNAPGVIDSSYRGELKVVLINHSRGIYIVSPGAKIAQLLIQDVDLPAVEVVNELPEPFTDRGDNGFGSTGE